MPIQGAVCYGADQCRPRRARGTRKWGLLLFSRPKKDLRSGFFVVLIEQE